MISKKMLLLFELIFLILFSAIFYIMLNYYDVNEAKQRLEYSLYENQAIENYNNKFQKTSIEKLKKKGLLPKDFFNIELMSSSYMSREIHKEYKNILKSKHTDAREYFSFKYASKNPLNKLNKANVFEATLIDKMVDENKNIYNEVVSIDNKDVLLHASLERNAKACLQCHGDPKDAPKELISHYGVQSGLNEKEGDVRGVFLIYTPIDFHNHDKNIFFASVIGLVIVMLLFIYFIMQYYAKLIKRKDELLIQQSQYATLGEIGEVIVSQWREPLSQISIRLDNILMDYEFNDFDKDKNVERLDEAVILLREFSSSIEKFRKLYNPQELAEYNKPTVMIDEAIKILHKQSTLNDIVYLKIYDTHKSIYIKRNAFFMVSLQLIKAFIELSHYFESRGMTIHIRVSEDAGMKIQFYTNISLSPTEQNHFMRDSNSDVTIAKLLVEEQLGGRLDLDISDHSVYITLYLPDGKSGG